MTTDSLSATAGVDTPTVPIAVLVGGNGSGKTQCLEEVTGRDVVGPHPKGVIGRGEGYLLITRKRSASFIVRPGDETMIVVDRLGQDLHPDKLAPFCDWLRGKQIPVLAATVSPYAVDCFAYGEVWVLHNGRAARLDQHPDVDTWRRELQAGEFWFSVGESWVAECPYAISLTELVKLLRSQICLSTAAGNTSTGAATEGRVSGPRACDPHRAMDLERIADAVNDAVIAEIRAACEPDYDRTAVTLRDAIRDALTRATLGPHMGHSTGTSTP